MTLHGSELSIQWDLMGAGVDMQHAPHKCTVAKLALIIRAQLDFMFGLDLSDQQRSENYICLK